MIRIIFLKVMDFRTILFGLNVLISGILVYVGIKQAMFLSRWNRKLDKIKKHEETVFKEVVGKG